jgi:hypothetical protein
MGGGLPVFILLNIRKCHRWAISWCLSTSSCNIRVFCWQRVAAMIIFPIEFSSHFQRFVLCDVCRRQSLRARTRWGRGAPWWTKFAPNFQKTQLSWTTGSISVLLDKRMQVQCHAAHHIVFTRPSAPYVHALAVQLKHRARALVT